MDVEGCDGRERGDSLDFELKAALFSLAVSQIVCINIWESSIGLVHSSGMALLRSVLSAFLHIKLPNPLEKTTLYFIVRDYTGLTPTSSHESILKEDITKIWQSLVASEDSEFPAELKFHFVPHKVYANAQFLASVEELRKTIESLALEKLQSHSSKSVRGNDFFIYARMIWNSILESKYLDVPSQQLLLAEHRVNQIKNSCKDRLIELCQPLDSFLEDKTKKELGNDLDYIYKKVMLEGFDVESQPYSKPLNENSDKSQVFEDLRNALENEIVNECLYKLYQKQLILLAVKTNDSFKTHLYEMCSYSQSEVESLESEARLAFEEACKGNHDD